MLQESKPRTKKSSSQKKTAQPQRRSAQGKNAAAGPEKPAPRSVTLEQRHQMIAKAAYVIAEQRGFVGGNTLDDWLTAEAQYDEQLLQKRA